MKGGLLVNMRKWPCTYKMLKEEFVLTNLFIKNNQVQIMFALFLLQSLMWEKEDFFSFLSERHFTQIIPPCLFFFSILTYALSSFPSSSKLPN